MSRSRNRGARAGLLLACVLAALAAMLGPTPVAAGDGVVRAVLFYSPTCPHCQQVLNEDLPPLHDRFGDQLQIVIVDVSREGGATLYEAAVAAFAISDDRLGVPTMVIGEDVLVGSVEIPARASGLIEDGIAQGGVDWPAIPGLLEALATPPPTPQPSPSLSSRPSPSSSRPPSASLTPSPTPGRATASPAAVEPSAEPTAVPTLAPDELDLSLAAISDRFDRDPQGNSVAVAVLIFLLMALAVSLWSLWRRWPLVALRRPSILIGLLTLVGLAVATNLASVELTGGAAVCGPVGDCNAVHTSTYARLFGIPVGVLGVAGYVGILGAWLLWRYAAGSTALMAQRALLLLAVAGTMFSIYLTFLEPFVIGATCGWCLISGVTMAAILLLASASPRFLDEPRPGQTPVSQDL